MERTALTILKEGEDATDSRQIVVHQQSLVTQAETLAAPYATSTSSVPVGWSSSI